MAVHSEAAETEDGVTEKNNWEGEISKILETFAWDRESLKPLFDEVVGFVHETVLTRTDDVS